MLFFMAAIANADPLICSLPRETRNKSANMHVYIRRLSLPELLQKLRIIKFRSKDLFNIS